MIATAINQSEHSFPDQTVTPQADSDGTERFTLDGSAELEHSLKTICDKVRVSVPSLVPPRKLEAILLGGGYGRGEGGVLTTSNGDEPYNDLEFYVFIKGPTGWNQRKYQPALDALAKIFSHQSGVEVEFKILSVKKLRRAAPSMFYYDLLIGHRQVLGEPSLLNRCSRHREAEALPQAEAARLLMNRLTGLLLAGELLQADPLTDQHTDFIGRNLAKTQLALGDAVLTARGQYHWSCRTRQRRLPELKGMDQFNWWEPLKQHYEQGVAFKLHPYRAATTDTTLARRFRELRDLSQPVWLWVENQRLQYPFQSVTEYACHPLNKWPETSSARNRLLNAKAFGPSQILAFRACRHPRERLMHALPLLLWEPLLQPGCSRWAYLQAELRTRAETRSGMIDAYSRLWRQFS